VHGSDKIIAVSNFVKNALVEETFTFEDKIIVVHNGIDERLFSAQEDITQRGDKILYVGQVIKSKGIFDLIKVFKYEDFSDKTFDIVGGGEALKEAKEAVSESNEISGKINFLGKVSYSELIEKYFLNKDYGLFVLPTLRYEGLPMVLLEAMFSGLPIVAYDMGGVSDAVNNGNNGFLVEAGNVESLRSRILDILKDPDLKEKMSKMSLQKAKEEFTLKKMLDAYEMIMQEVLA
jgi:glycosyltransferase involved in cell wall biosynthesis